jgi:hypothetical protein
MESEHERAISNFQDQLKTSEEEIEQLKIFIESFQHNEKLTSISDPLQIGIKNDSIRDNTLAWHVQQEEVNIHFYLIPCLSAFILLSFTSV